MKKDLEKTKEFNKINPKGGKNNMPKKGSRVKNGFAYFLSAITTVFVVGVISVSLFVMTTIATAKPISADDFEQTDSTVVLDADDNVIYDLGVKLIENVEYEDISQSLIDAFVSIEDSRFFVHKGFDLPRFTSAMIKNVLSTITSGSLSFDAGGASTIDMQLTRNVLFMIEDATTGEVSMPAASGIAGIKRKVNEIHYARKLNNKKILDKKTIFQKYVNQINFGTGNNMLGVQKAAKYYFDKDVSELNTIESAFLAGVINAPAVYTPYYSLTYATERTHQVLYYMNYHGYIDDFEYQQALSIPLENIFVEQTHSKADALPNQAYIDVVLDEVEELTGLNPATTPMIIKTAMNPRLQSELDKAQNREIPYLDISTVNGSNLQMASTVIDNATGEIIGIFGGYDYYGQRIFNRAYHGLYQPGSTVKPFVSYAPAFEYLGYATSHTFLDEPYTWAGTDIVLKNWDNTYRGEVTLKQAVSNSYNIPAVKTYEAVENKIGHARYVDYIEAIGFTRYAEKLDAYFEMMGIDNKKGRDEFNAQFAIGGHEFYTNTVELAGATATILNGGDYIKPHTIREVTIQTTGETIENPYKATPVLSDSAAYLTAKTMRDVIDDNRYINVERYVAKHYPVYGKTGTTNWSSKDSEEFGVPSGSAKDRLLLTGTDRFSMATWTGFDAADVNKKDGKSYISPAEHNFQAQGRLNGYILDILEEEFGAGKAIERPSTVKEITHILGTFPYQSPIKGMNPDLVTKGLIKADAAQLVPATPPELESLKSSEVNIIQQGNANYLEILFDAYPDKSKLTKANSTMIMEFNGRKYTGRRLFDASWIFGPVRYQTDILVNGEIIDSIIGDKEKQTFKLDSNISGKIEVCTFYTFELNQDKTSNKVCHDVDTKNLKIKVPRFTDQEQLDNFANTYNITLNTNYVVNSSLNRFDQIISINPNLQGKKVTVGEIQDSQWMVEIGDYVINFNEYINRTGNQFVEQFRNYIQHLEVNGDGNAHITQFTDGSGTPLTSRSLSQIINNGETIIIHTE